MNAYLYFAISVIRVVKKTSAFYIIFNHPNIYDCTQIPKYREVKNTMMHIYKQINEYTNIYIYINAFAFNQTFFFVIRK